MESTIARPRPIQATTSSRFAGAGNVFQKELREWFRTRRFLVTAVLTSLMLGAVPVVVFLHQGGLHDGRVDSGYRGVMNAWVALTLTLGAYLIVALTMSIIVKEEDGGTAQWIFTKPVSRSGYVLAKYAANVVAVVLGAVVIPSLVLLALTGATQSGGIQNWTAVVQTIGFASLHAAIVVGLVVGLSGLFRSSAPIAGIAIGMGFVPLFFNDKVPQQLTNLFPVEIGNIASQAVRGDHLAPWQPVVCGIALLAVSLAFACYRIERRQLQ